MTWSKYARMMFTNNSVRKSTGMCGRYINRLGKVSYWIQYTKWKFKAPDRAIEEMTTVYFPDYIIFKEHYDKFKCSKDEMTSAWGRYGDAVFPTKVN